MVKLHEVVSPSVRLGLAALVVALAACEPTPKYPVPEQPVVGVILEEQSAQYKAAHAAGSMAPCSFDCVVHVVCGKASRHVDSVATSTSTSPHMCNVMS